MAFTLPKSFKRYRFKLQKYLPWVASVIILAIAIVVWQSYLGKEKIVVIEPISLKPRGIEISFEAFGSPLVITPPELDANLFANPPAGNVPLENVDLNVSVFGTMIGPISYKFDCENDGTFELETTEEKEGSYKAQALCNYKEEGEYTAKVYIKRGDKEIEKVAIISVTTKNNPPTISSCNVYPQKGTTQSDFQFKFTVEATDPDNDILLYDWDFGDNSEHSAEQTAYHHYDKEGSYAPNVAVYDLDEQGNKKGGSDICFLTGVAGFFRELIPFEEIKEFEGEPGRQNPFIAY